MDSKEIIYKRSIIKKEMIDKVLYKKGGENFISLNGNDIEHLFKLYDNIFFNNEILTKIMKDGDDIQFLARSRLHGPAGICGIKYVSPSDDAHPLDKGYIRLGYHKQYFLDMAPNVIESLVRKSALSFLLSSGIGCNDRLSCLQIVMEHQIVHLLCLIWDFVNNDEKSKRLYGPHGLLFKCMIYEYFGHTIANTDIQSRENSPPEEITDVVLDESAKKTPANFLKYKDKRSIIKYGFQNWANSCYLDSVLIVLFDSASPFWRKGIMDVNVDTIEYKGGCKYTDIDNIDKIKELAKRVQTQMKSDYKTLSTGTMKCTILRELLLKCLPGMKRDDRWVLYNTGMLYDAFTMLFPSLLLNIPYQIARYVHPSVVPLQPDNGPFPLSSSPDDGDQYIWDSVDYVSEASLTMWDYLDPLDSHEEKHDYKKIRWDLINSPVLVFYNGGTPRVKEFDVSGKEESFVYIRGDKSKQLVKYNFEINKARSFGEYIINSRYRLIGVVVLEGISAVGEGGSHYTSYFLSPDGSWYHYDDLQAVSKKIDSLPREGVFVESGGRMPSMYFYQKISDSKDIEHETSTQKQGSSVLARKKNISEKKMETKFVNGEFFDYKMTKSGNSPNDISYLYFVYDKINGKALPLIEQVIPYTTKLEDTVKMWKIQPKDVDTFQTILSKANSGARRFMEKKSPQAKVIKKYEKIGTVIYDYSDKTVLVTSDNPKVQLLLMRDGIKFGNLKYGIRGAGYVYPKTKLDDISQRLEDFTS